MHIYIIEIDSIFVKRKNYVSMVFKNLIFELDI